MLNDKDKSSVLDQISDLKMCSNKIREHLSAIQLLMVDDNNSCIKDDSISGELSSLTKQIDSVTGSIDAIEKKLM